MTSPAADEEYGIFQTSTMAALLAGVYDGTLTIGELLQHGDFGLGTFNDLDGEMIVLDGTCHHLRSDGSAQVAAPDEKTPYAAIVRFRPKVSVELTEPILLRDLGAAVDRYLESANTPVAVRVSGQFTAVRTRTVGRQTPPYPPLIDATAHEAVNLLHHSPGTAAGFRTPRFEAALAVPGFHLHFIDAGQRQGGHVLDFALERGQLSLMPVTELHLSLPTHASYRDAEFDLQRLETAENEAESQPKTPLPLPESQRP